MKFKIKGFWIPKPPIDDIPYYNCFFCKKRFEGDGIKVKDSDRNLLIKFLLKLTIIPFHIPVEHCCKECDRNKKLENLLK
jgi:hypothetical protein